MKVDPEERGTPSVDNTDVDNCGNAAETNSDPGAVADDDGRPERTGGVSSGLLSPGLLTADARGDAGGGLEVSPSSAHDFEAQTRQLCEELILDVKTQEEASKLLRRCRPLLDASIGAIGSSSVEEMERLWRACGLYMVKTLGTGTSIGGTTIEGGTAGFTLSQLLKASGLSVVDFFKEIPHFMAKCGEVLRLTYGDEWELKPQVKEVQANFVHMMVLCNHYKRVFADCFMILDGRGVALSVSGAGGTGAGGMNNHMRFGWMLFLVLKARRMTRFPDLVTCTNGLLCVVITLLLHMPVSLRKFSFDENKRFPVRSSEGADLLASLAGQYNAMAEDVVKLMGEMCVLVAEILKRQPTPSQPHCQQEQLAGVIPAAKNWYFEGLLDERALLVNLAVLEKSYDVAYHEIGDLDERIFMNIDQKTIGNVASLTPRKGIAGTGEGMASPQRGYASNFLRSTASPSRSPFASFGQSPVRKMMGHVLPPTPVSSTMTNANWLRTIVLPLSGEPSEELVTFFKDASTPERDIGAEVTRRVHVLLNSIFMQSGTNGAPPESPTEGRPSAIRSLFSSGSDTRWAEQRALEAKKLYYRVLESMCRIESSKMDTLSLLLGNEAFHRSLLACASEMVLAAHKTIQLQFPAVLTAVGITAFDFNKVTESFVRIEDSLPRELKRHLNSIDERILESMAWEKGSTLYPPLLAAYPNLRAEVERLGLFPEPMPPLDSFRPPADTDVGATPPPEGPAAQPLRRPPPPRLTIPVITSNLAFLAHERNSAFQAFSAPIRAELLATQPSLQSTFMSPQKKHPSGNGETVASTQINIFFKKVLLLAKYRIEHLGKRLCQNEFILWQVYSVVEHALMQKTALFFCRHIDQIILCSMYGVCKVRHAEVTFKSTILQYKEQTQSKPHVFRNVFIDHSRRGSRNPEMGDIIRFYNEIYVPAIKVFLLSLPVSPLPPTGPLKGQAEGEAGAGPGSPPRGIPFQALPSLSPQKVSSKHNVYVSPLRANKVEAMMAPQPRSLVAQLGGSPQGPPRTSRELDAINSRVNQTGRQATRPDFGDEGSPLMGRGVGATGGRASNLSTDSQMSQASARSSARPLPTENASPSPMKRSRMM